MAFKKVFAALALTCASAMAFAADMPKEINIAYVKAPFNLQNMVMKQQGILEKAFASDNVKVNWKTITSGAKQAQAMAAGALDVSAVMNTASLLMANGAGNSVLIANGVAHPSEVFAIVGKAGEKMTVADLKGKKVAGPRGTVLHQLLVAALVKNGMKPTDVEFLAMDIPSALAAVTSGHVDAALLAASAVIKAEEAGCQVITNAKGLVNVNLVMTVSKDFAEKHPEALAKIVQAQRDTLKWINANKAAAIELGAKEHGISMKDAEKLASWSHYYDQLGAADVAGLKEDQQFLIENGMMAKSVDVEALVLPTAAK